MIITTIVLTFLTTIVSTNAQSGSVISFTCGAKQKSALESQGRRYTLAYMEMQPTSDDARSPRQYMVQATTDRTYPIGVVVRNPQKQNELVNFTTVRRGIVSTMDMRGSMLKAEGAKVFEQKTLTVEADDNIKVYVSSQQGKSRYGYWALPDTALGTEYYAMTYAPLDERVGGKSEIGIIPVDPGKTKITVRMPRDMEIQTRSLIVEFNNQQYTYGETFEAEIEQNDFMQIRCIQGDMSGAKVTGNKKFVFFSGNTKVSLGQRVGMVGEKAEADSVVEQLTPVNTWGEEFVSFIPPPDVFYMRFRIKVTTAYNATNFRIHQRNIFLSYAGDSVELELDQYEKGTPIYFKANKPVQVVQFVQAWRSSRDKKSAKQADTNEEEGDVILVPNTGTNTNSQGEAKSRVKRAWRVADPHPSMILLPSVDQWDYRYTFDAKKYDYNKDWVYSYVLVVMIREEFRRGLLFNGKNIGKAGIDWQKIWNTPFYVGHREITWGYHTLSHSDERATFGAWLYGAQDVGKGSFGYALGMRLQSTSCERCPVLYCDVRDNDCDYDQDEELCDGKDNDGDGLIDEDCCGFWEIQSDPKAGKTWWYVISGGMALAGIMAVIVATTGILGTGQQ